MPDLKIKCLNKKCGHTFIARDVKADDIRTCFKCGKKRKIYNIYVTCTACYSRTNYYVQDGTQFIVCNNCGNYEPIYAPQFIP